jgi:hypothetical protein
LPNIPQCFVIFTSLHATYLIEQTDQRKSHSMSDNNLVPRSKQIPSFEEFKEIVLQLGSDRDFLNRVATLYGKVPRLIRILHNFDPTGTASAIDQLISEEKSEREQDNILRVIYVLAVKVWNPEDTELPNLSEKKFLFLYFVYAKSQTDVFTRVELNEIQSYLHLPQQRIISIGEFLDKNGLIEFSTWVEGVEIAHRGITRIEADLLGSNVFPEFVDVNEINKIEERIRLRFDVLQYLYKKSEGDTYQQILHEDIAREMEIDHHNLIAQSLPYMAEEGWVIWSTADSVRITEEGIDIVQTLLSEKS